MIIIIILFNYTFKDGRGQAPNTPKLLLIAVGLAIDMDKASPMRDKRRAVDAAIGIGIAIEITDSAIDITRVGVAIFTSNCNT